MGVPFTTLQRRGPDRDVHRQRARTVHRRVQQPRHLGELDVGDPSTRAVRLLTLGVRVHRGGGPLREEGVLGHQRRHGVSGDGVLQHLRGLARRYAGLLQ